MITIFGAIALSLAVPAPAQSAPLAGQPANHSHCQAAQGQQAHKNGMAEMHKGCPDMMKHHAKMGRRAKTEAERLDAEVNGNGHQGHNH
ncbi:hypothetical protein LZ496_06610 [Sphingomonas sp. NSE70-1]|uniref:Pentapeptide MXKDX repeat protein n=1 Tax=Sphingomonas caseinilyticus TaxID=2908205 RepID=A0ABT0RUE0_9SPHN|nr:hypothetical protein [Sphingomonas caseinilyticus]MCL6698453.1 hypothetical protein [Sphingomonas caseinilyticus]